MVEYIGGLGVAECIMGGLGVAICIKGGFRFQNGVFEAP